MPCDSLLHNPSLNCIYALGLREVGLNYCAYARELQEQLNSGHSEKKLHTMSDIDIQIEVGDNGAGEHCEDQFMRYGGGAAIGGKVMEDALIRIFFSAYTRFHFALVF